MKTASNVLLFVCLLVLSGCKKEEQTLPFRAAEKQQQPALPPPPSPYTYITVTPSDDYCTILNNLSDYSWVNLLHGTYDMQCDILLNGKNHIVIEGVGTTFEYNPNGSGQNTHIIHIDGCSDVTLRNIDIQHQGTKPSVTTPPLGEVVHHGRIKVTNSSLVTLDDLWFSHQQITGSNFGHVHQVYFSEASYSTIKGSRMENCDGELILLEASTNCTVEGNILNKGWSGIGTIGKDNEGSLVFGSNNKLLSNTVTNSSTAYITVNDRHATVEGNTIERTEYIEHGPGIRLGHDAVYKYANGAVVKNNTIKNLNLARGSYYPGGIKVDYTITASTDEHYNNVRIEDNTITNCTGGIRLSNQPGQHVRITGNTIDADFMPALDLYSADDLNAHACWVEGNTLKGPNDIVTLYNAQAEIIGNTLTMTSSYGDKAILIQRIQQDQLVNVVDNTIVLWVNSPEYGIFCNVSNYKGGAIKGNTIHNGKHGIFVKGDDLTIESNTLHYQTDFNIYLLEGTLDTKILGNTTNNTSKSGIYLKDTDGTRVEGNTLNKTTSGGFAIWRNSPATNTNNTISGNTMTGYTVMFNP